MIDDNFRRVAEYIGKTAEEKQEFYLTKNDEIKLEIIDGVIGRHAKGWKTSRISKVSRSILRLCVYEMLYEEIPYSVSINEAVELAKKFDDEKARPFINGILNSVKNALEAK